MITGKDNPKVKYIKKLLDKSSFRNSEKKFVAEGLRAVKECNRFGTINQLYISSGYEGKMSENRELSDVYNEIKADIKETVKDDIFNKISDTKSPQGILAIVDMPEVNPDVIYEKKNASVLVLDEVRDPGNIGTIIRTAQGMGFDAVIFSKGCADIYQPKIVRSTMGSLLKVPCIKLENDIKTELEVLKKRGFTIYATALKNSVNITEIVFNDKAAIIIGNEANGISDEAFSMSDQNITIPMENGLESYNASVAASILMYEAGKRNQ